MIDSILQLVKSAPVLESSDTVRRAAGLIRASEGSSLLVLREGGIAGSVSERGIAAFLGTSDNRESALDAPVGTIVESGPMFVNSNVSLSDAARVFAAHGVDVLPVIDQFGGYQGMLYRRDLIGYMTRNLRPQSVAGMATPLGVYLTTGSHSGGAGSLGLFLTGISLALMITFASLIVTGLQKLFAMLTGIRVDLFVSSPPISLAFVPYDIAFYVSIVLTIVIMLLLLRLSPLSGYHAAEHMTVHAIEAGEALTPDAVRKMPRVHPRCGTNLLAAAGVFVIITTRLGGEFAVLVAIMVVIIGWRAAGGWLQYLVTTKNPNERQLANGVAAGNELLDKYQDQPNHQVYGFERIWNMGFLQTAAGMATVFGVLGMLQKFFHFPMLKVLF